MPKISRADGEKYAKDFLTAFAAGFKENNHIETLAPFLADKLSWDWSDDTKGEGTPADICGKFSQTWGAMVDSFNLPSYQVIVDTSHAKVMICGPLIINVTGPGNLVPNNLVYNPVSFIWTLDDAGKCTMWEGYWDQEDAGMTAALGAVMAKMPKSE